LPRSYKIIDFQISRYALFSLVILPINSVINPLLYDDVITARVSATVHKMYGEVKTLVIFLIGPLRNKLAKVEVERFSMHEVPRIRYVKGSVRMADEPAVILTKKEAETPACSEVKVVEKTSVKKTSVKKTSAKKTSAEKTSAKKNQGPPRSKRKVRVPRKKSEETSVSGNTSIHNGPQLIAKPRSTKAGEGQADGKETVPRSTKAGEGQADGKETASCWLTALVDGGAPPSTKAGEGQADGRRQFRSQPRPMKGRQMATRQFRGQPRPVKDRQMARRQLRG